MPPLLLLAMVYDTLKKGFRNTIGIVIVFVSASHPLCQLFLRFTIGVRQITNGNHELPHTKNGPEHRIDCKN